MTSAVPSRARTRNRGWQEAGGAEDQPGEHRRGENGGQDAELGFLQLGGEDAHRGGLVGTVAHPVPSDQRKPAAVPPDGRQAGGCCPWLGIRAGSQVVALRVGLGALEETTRNA
jgi:hypothetical protein